MEGIIHWFGDGMHIPNLPSSLKGSPMKNSKALMAHARKMASIKPLFPIILDLIFFYVSKGLIFCVNLGSLFTRA